MSKFLRIVLVGLLILSIGAGSALAGPGRNESGDPEIPNISIGKGCGYLAAPSDSGSGVISHDVQTRTSVSEQWVKAFRLYLQFVRVLAR